MTFLPATQDPTDLISPQLREWMRQQQIMNMLANAGRGLLEAGARGADFGPGLLAGLGQANAGGGYGLLDLARAQGAINTIQNQQAERQRQQRQAAAYSELLGGHDPATGITWETGRQLPQAAPSGAAAAPPQTLADQLGLSGAQQGLLRAAGPEAGMPALMKQVFTQPKAPTTREFKEGDQLVTKRWNPATRDWEQVGVSPRWSPDEGGGPTAAQQANNAEIDAARTQLRTLYPGLNREQITELTTEARSTGMPNPDFDQTLSRLLRIASQRKVGTDPVFDRLFGQYYGPAPPPIPDVVTPESFTAPGRPSAAPLPERNPAMDPQALLQGSQNLLYGPTAAARPRGTNRESSTPGRRPSPRALPGRPGSRQDTPAEPPRLANGGLDRDRLVTGRLYQHPTDGRLYRWTGAEFERVE